MKKKLLVIGVSGLTGYKIAKITKNDYEVFGTYNERPVEIESCNTIKLNITDSNEIEKINEIKPDIIINTSALHNVDFCETNPDDANNVNSKAPEQLNKICQKNDSKLIHISTDYVFDGNAQVPYVEEDTPIPISQYGQSKLDGEKLIQSNSIILRPSVVYGWTPLELSGKTSSSGKPINFALWVLTKLHENEQLKIVTDQFASATLADSLASSALTIAQSDKKSGLYHISGLSCESRYDFTVKLAEIFGYDPSLISPVDLSGFKQKAKRPKYSCLSSSKAIKEFDLKLYSTVEALNIMKNQVETEAPHLLGNYN